ncbi:hypothetical protein BDF14DRAFT_1749596 [Spinellus fusiger]|nr:hypothetical protein BDF14DRAFT_1749596 [Spinellus fusiger]
MKPFRSYLNEKHIYMCNTCHCHLFARSNITDNEIVNINFDSENKERSSTHSINNNTAANIYCSQCHTHLGQHVYINTPDTKESFIVKKRRIVKQVNWCVY